MAEATQKATHESVKQTYGKQMVDPLLEEFNSESDFHNLGYWSEETTTAKEASENLLERLLDLIPDKTGTILDVACGKGATSRYLLKYYPAEAITGTDLLEKYEKIRQKNAPDVKFLIMNATQLRFDDNTFDNVISVEAAFHFDTRLDFFREAFRVLKPGGRLVVSDVLKPRALKNRAGEGTMPDANVIADMSEYEAVWKEAGFVNLTLEDATKSCSEQWRKEIFKFALKKRAAQEIDEQRMKRIKYALAISKRSNSLYALASGVKPT